MMRFVFWQPSLSMHQSAFLSTLAAKKGVDVLIVAERKFSKGREQQGWVAPNFGKASFLVNPSQSECDDILKEKPAQSIHIFSNLGSNRFLTEILMSAIFRSLRCAVLAETPDNRGIATIARYFRDCARALYFDQHLEFFLAIGTRAVQWYEAAGFAPKKTFPFGYFIDAPKDNKTTVFDTPSKPKNTPIEIVFLGSLIPLKGVDLLLKADRKSTRLNSSHVRIS